MRLKIYINKFNIVFIKSKNSSNLKLKSAYIIIIIFTKTRRQ